MDNESNKSSSYGYKDFDKLKEAEIYAYRKVISRVLPGLQEDVYTKLSNELYLILNNATLNPEDDVENENNITVQVVINRLSTTSASLSRNDAKTILKVAKNVRRYIATFINESFNDEKARNEYLKGISDGVIEGPMTGNGSVDKPWLKHYDIDRINVDVPEVSIYEYMKNRCTDFNLIAIDYFGKKITYKEMFNNIDRLARSFHKMGIRKGDSVALLLPNTPESVYTLYALNKIGAIANIIDLRKKESTLVHAINETKPKAVIGTDIFASSIDNVKDELCTDNIYFSSIFDSTPKHIKTLGKAFGIGLPKEIDYQKEKKIVVKYKSVDDLMAYGDDYEVDIKPISTKDDIVAVVHTSGTTGESKAVQLTNYNYNTMVYEYEGVIVKSKPGEKILTQVPPFLAYTTIMATHLPLCLNVTLVMVPEYEPDKTSDRVYKYKIEHIVGAPGDYYSFLENPKTPKRDYSYIKTLGSGSDTLGTKVRTQVDILLANSGCTTNIFEGYGMTEVGSAAVTNLPYYVVDNSVGIPLAKMSVKIINPETKEECKYGEIGEICFTGGTMTNGYYENDAANEELMITDENGVTWIRSGDAGFMNENGNIFYRGRLKRTIVLFEGIKVNPLDIEDILNKDDRVDASCVIGIKNVERGRGELPIANIVIKDEYKEDADKILEDLQKLCEKELGPNYVPKKFISRDALPLTSVGKVDFIGLSKMCESEINLGKEQIVQKEPARTGVYYIFTKIFTRFKNYRENQNDSRRGK